MIKAFKVATLGFIVSVLPIAHAQDKQNTLSQTDLDKMSDQFIELRNKSKSKFEKWHVDMLAFTLNTCAINSKLELDKSIKSMFHNYFLSKILKEQSPSALFLWYFTHII